MKIIVKASRFNSPTKLDRIYTISEFVENLLEYSLYEAGEIDQTALKIYLVVFYINQVSNNGFLNFLRKNYMNVTALDQINDGLGEIGAIKHQEVYQEACAIFHMLDEDSLESLVLTGDNNLDDRFRSKTVPVCFGMGEQDEKFTSLQRGEEVLTDLLYDFVGRINNVYIVHDSRYNEEIEKIYAQVPDYEKRLQAAEAHVNTPPERDLTSIIAELCTKFNLNLIAIETVNHGEGLVDEEQVTNNINISKIYCYFTTEEGNFYTSYQDNEAKLYEKRDNKYVGHLFLN